MERIYKTLPADVQSLPDSRQIKFIISTGAVDRDGDIIDPKGWELGHYRKSPVVLWSHDYNQMPIAKAVSIEQTDKGLAAVAEFPQKGVYPFADQVYDMVKGGFLNATSVGFRPLEHEKSAEGGGRNYRKQELLEFSVVPVPANPEALAQRGVSNDEAAKWKAVVKGWAEAVKEETPWERLVKELDARCKDGDEYTGDPRAKFLADVEVESEAGTKALGEARLLKLLRMNGLKKTADLVEKADEMAACMADPHMNEKFPDEKQRYAVCMNGGGKGIQAEAKGLTLEVQDPLVFEVQEDLIEMPDAEHVGKLIAQAQADCLGELIRAEVTRVVNHALGRVS